MCFWVAQEFQRGAQRGERKLQEQKAFKKKYWGQCQLCLAVGVLQSLVHSSSDRKSAGHKKKNGVWNIIIEDLSMSEK